MTASSIIVVDTNVWLDYLLGFRQHHSSAKNLILEAHRRSIPLVIPAHSLKDLFFLFQQQIKLANKADGKQTPEVAARAARVSAWAAIDLIMELAAVGPSDQGDAWIASKQRAVHDDFEDNLVVATAMHVDARLLVTNDVQLLKHSPIAALNASDALRYLQAL